MKEKIEWGDAEIRLIKDEWGAGKTAAEIAAQLNGRSRNAVLGKAHRLGLPPRFIRDTGAMAKKKEKKKSAASRETVTDHHVSDVRYQPEETPANLVSLLDLKNGQCSWPYGDPKEPGFGFCGAECKAGSVYCAGHHKRAFQPSWRKDYDDGRILHGVEKAK